MYERDIEAKKKLAELLEKKQRYANLSFKQAQDAMELQKKLQEKALKGPSGLQKLGSTLGTLATIGGAGLSLVPGMQPVGIGLAMGGLGLKSLSSGGGGGYEPALAQLAFQNYGNTLNQPQLGGANLTAPESSYGAELFKSQALPDYRFSNYGNVV